VQMVWRERPLSKRLAARKAAEEAAAAEAEQLEDTESADDNLASN
jgi:hypothetical protein